MKKRNQLMALLCGCMLAFSSGAQAEQSEGTVLNIFSWSEAFRTYFDAYYPLPEGITVNWTIVPKVQGRYMDALDKALLLQDNASADTKIDLFLADPDYLVKYVSSDVTADIQTMGVTDFSNAYDYTVQACTDDNGAIKGAACWLHPGVTVYRKTFAKKMLGTDDPVKVQEAVADWETFSQTAKQAAEMEYFMTPSYASTFPAFFQHMEDGWVKNGAVSLPPQMEEWVAQSIQMIADETTQGCGVMDDDATEQALAKVGKGLFFFGTDEYINGIMWESQNNRNEETTGDWSVCKGPAGYSKDDVYLMAAAGTDNPVLVGDIINTFLNNEDVCAGLVKEQGIFTNHMAVNASMTEEPALANEFLGGQNPFAAFIASAEDMVYENRTLYDPLLNETLLEVMKKYCSKECDLISAENQMKKQIQTVYPTLDVSAFTLQSAGKNQ